MNAAVTASRCYIDLDAIRHNFQQLGNPGELLPVIKSDAYGHGLLETARALNQAGAERFAVGLAEEGEILVSAGLPQDIYILEGCLNDADWDIARQFGLVPLIGNFESLQKAAAAPKPQPIAIKVNTGMNRLGFNPEDAGAISDFLLAHPVLQPRLVVSHLACADMPEENDYTCMQRNIFSMFYEQIRQHFPGVKSSQDNSAAMLESPSGDIRRPGLALYGGNPFKDGKNPNLRWAMSVSAPLIQVRDLEPGQSVSYGRKFVAKKSMRIGIVACGYATGYIRTFSNKASMLVHGRRVPQIGRVCMSMTMIDLSNVPEAHSGDLAWLLGGAQPGDDEPVTAWEMANWLDTVPHEVLCFMGRLNSRIYLPESSARGV